MDMIFIVDDEAPLRDIIKRFLTSEYEVLAFSKGEDVIRAIEMGKVPKCVIMDIHMPGINGFETIERLRSFPGMSQLPVVFLTAQGGMEYELEGLSKGGVDFITKPVPLPVLKARISNQIELYEYRTKLEDQVESRTRELEQTQLEIVYSLAAAAEYRDNETGNHIKRISRYTKKVAEAMGYDNEYASLLSHASPMHDVGKIGIPDSILLKSGSLTEAEWEIMKTHCTIGARILSESNSPLMRCAKEIALNHHERWDGKGYPRGLSGDNIPISGRITSVCDIFDALTSERPYKSAWSVEASIAEIQKLKGSALDPQVVDFFLSISALDMVGPQRIREAS